jgi:hypothetical protein
MSFGGSRVDLCTKNSFSFQIILSTPLFPSKSPCTVQVRKVATAPAVARARAPLVDTHVAMTIGRSMSIASDGTVSVPSCLSIPPLHRDSSHTCCPPYSYNHTFLFSYNNTFLPVLLLLCSQRVIHSTLGTGSTIGRAVRPRMSSIPETAAVAVAEGIAAGEGPRRNPIPATGEGSALASVFAPLGKPQAARPPAPPLPKVEDPLPTPADAAAAGVLAASAVAPPPLPAAAAASTSAGSMRSFNSFQGLSHMSWVSGAWSLGALGQCYDN